MQNNLAALIELSKKLILIILLWIVEFFNFCLRNKPVYYKMINGELKTTEKLYLQKKSYAMCLVEYKSLDLV